MNWWGGLNAAYNLSGDGEIQLIGGAYYRGRRRRYTHAGISVEDAAYQFLRMM